VHPFYPLPTFHHNNKFTANVQSTAMMYSQFAQSFFHSLLQVNCISGLIEVIVIEGLEGNFGFSLCDFINVYM